VTRNFTRVKSLRVLKTPAGATIHLGCAKLGGGSGCPFKSKTLFVGNAGTVVLTGYFTKHLLRPGTKVKVRVTKPTFVGKGVIYTIRSGKKPSAVLTS
jgi:hypothetical protein